MGQRDLLLVRAQIRSVSTWGKETYYWCWLKYGKYRGKETCYWFWLKYGKYMGKRDLPLVLAQIRQVLGAKRPVIGVGSNAVSKYMGQRELLLVLVKI